VTEWTDIGALADVERDGRLVARVGGREIGVVRDERTGTLHGVRNRCPHHGGPLCLGRIGDRIAGTPGRYASSPGRVLRCPWHGWEFDPASGRCLDDPSLRAAVYPVEVVNGRVRVRA
jgi:3-phenylpropionate/trans-cinnamate dioxygenase ferredoxin subunit